MSLTSLSFLGVYFPILIILYYSPFFKGDTSRKILLLFASIGLYTFCEPIYSLLLIGLILANYFLVKMSDRMGNDLCRIIAIVLDVSVLLFFKYINSVLSVFSTHSGVTSIIVPIGLSYFTFKAISYVVDSRYEVGDFLDVAVYISNFLTIVSGPLSKYQDELPMIQMKNETQMEDFYNGVERLSRGLIKKVLIADSLRTLVDQAFGTSELTFVMAWAGAIAYTLQLYFDFSGYTDMAIGVGTMFGFSLPENFDYPYIATSISDFWKRWHISLTKWFTNYIYIPLGGSRVDSVYRHIFNMFVVWLVTGMWHGSHMTFIVWAFIYFVLLIVEKYTRWTDILERYHVGHVYTLLVVMLEWVIFRAESLGAAFSYIRTMFMVNGNSFATSYDLQSIAKYIIPLLLGVIFSMGVGAKIRDSIPYKKVLNVAYNGVLLALYLLCIVISISQGYTAPLYAGF